MYCDGLNAKHFTFIPHKISVPLTHIFNPSIIWGIFLEKLKISRTVPILKNSNSERCDNYKPISLLLTNLVLDT